jgi:hypothetical protein
MVDARRKLLPRSGRQEEHDMPALVFITFIALTLRVRPGDTPATSLTLRLLIIYVVAISMVAGILGTDLWPFAAWRYVAYSIGDSGDVLRTVIVDRRGEEHPLDERAFEPLEPPELAGYVAAAIGRMPVAQRDELLEFLLRRAQEGLARARAGRPVGRFARLLGAAAAPVFQNVASPWDDRTHLPDEVTGLRVYREHWVVSNSTARIERRYLVAQTRR